MIVYSVILMIKWTTDEDTALADRSGESEVLGSSSRRKVYRRSSAA